MLCQKCKKNHANTHVKSVINGKTEEYMLCSECAKEMGYTDVFSDMHSDFNSILGSFFSNALPAKSEATRCPLCNSSFHDIQKSGYVGCAKCYEVFQSDLMPTIKRIHSNTTHLGKRPSVATVEHENAEKKPTVNELKMQLDEAVKEQNFELAAKLRDEIKEMEESK